MHEHQAVTIFPVSFTTIQSSLSSCIDIDIDNVKMYLDIGDFLMVSWGIEKEHWIEMR